MGLMYVGSAFRRTSSVRQKPDPTYYRHIKPVTSRTSGQGTAGHRAVPSAPDLRPRPLLLDDDVPLRWPPPGRRPHFEPQILAPGRRLDSKS